MKLRAKLVGSASLLREKVFLKFRELQNNLDSTNEVQVLKLLPAFQHAQHSPSSKRANSQLTSKDPDSTGAFLLQEYTSFVIQHFTSQKASQGTGMRRGSECPNSNKSMAASQNQQNKGGVCSLRGRCCQTFVGHREVHRELSSSRLIESTVGFAVLLLTW